MDCLRRMQDNFSANATNCCGAFSATNATDLIGKLGRPLFLGIVSSTSHVQRQCILSHDRLEQSFLISSLMPSIFISGEVMDEILQARIIQNCQVAVRFRRLFQLACLCIHLY